MSDVIEKEVEDLYQEHALHRAYEKKCSTCYSQVKEKEFDRNESDFFATAGRDALRGMDSRTSRELQEDNRNNPLE